LGIFPAGTQFRAIDDIDRCLLFVDRTHSRFAEADAYDSRNLHVALWHDDLLELGRRGLATGITGITELTWRLNRYRGIAGLAPARSSAEAQDGLPELFTQVPAGDFVPLPQPSEDDYDDEELEWALADIPIAVTPDGWRDLEQLLASTIEIPPKLVDRVGSLIEGRQYDTLVREVGAALETEMRMHLGSERYGVNLIEDFVTHLRASGGFLDAHLKILRIELLTAFKFERNLYAHRLVDVPQPQGLALTARFLALYSTVILACEGD
jgi:hypothetical protein